MHLIGEDTGLTELYYFLSVGRNELLGISGPSLRAMRLLVHRPKRRWSLGSHGRFISWARCADAGRGLLGVMAGMLVIVRN